jgi:hypothetical protein
LTVSFRWKTGDEGADASWRRVRCGYRKGSDVPVFGVMPPSMRRVHVGIFDASAHALRGWAVYPIADNKGASFEIHCVNYSDNAETINCHVETSGALPKEYLVRIVDPTGSAVANTAGPVDPAAVVVPANSTVRLIVAAGTPEYFTRVVQSFFTLKLIKVFPNPFRQKVSIQYRIPQGIQEIYFSLYNLHGQEIVRGVERNALTPGDHVFNFDNLPESAKDRFSSGIYIMRMTAKNSAGKIVFGGKQALTCIR